MNADSITFTGQGITGTNMYTYCANNPVIAVDYNGNWFMFLTAVVGAVIGAVIGGVTAAAKGENIVTGAATGAAIGGLVGIGFGAAAGVLLAGSATATGTAVGIGLNQLTAVVASGGIVAGSKLIADNISQAIRPMAHIFWSGGGEALKASQDVAGKVNGITLEMTRLGRYLEQLPQNNPVTRDLWIAASRNFANQATRIVYSVQNSTGIRIESIWATVEYRILQNSGVIESIKYGVLQNGIVEWLK